MICFVLGISLFLALVYRKGMHVLTTGRAQAILSHALTLLLQIRERSTTARTVHRPIGHSQLAPVTFVQRNRDSTQNVNLRITLTSLAHLEAAPVHTRMLVR